MSHEDLQLAIQASRKISEILIGIADNHPDYITINLKELKKTILTLEKSFYKNRADGVYDK